MEDEPAMIRVRLEHDSNFPDDPNRCPCDDCVDQVEQEHLALIREVWPHRLPYMIRIMNPPDLGSGMTIPPCMICGARFLREHGRYAEVSFYSYSSLTPIDPIPFHHVKRVLFHNTCAEILLDHDVGKNPIEEVERPTDENGQHHRHLVRMMVRVPSFRPRLASLVGYQPK